MTTEPSKDTIAAFAYLAEQLGIKNVQTTAIATLETAASARAYDGSLEATVVPNFDVVRVTSPRLPAIDIKLVDHNRDCLAPKEAVYEITALRPTREIGSKGEYRTVYELLNGDVFSVYVGPQGLILSEPARQRAAKLLEGERK